MAALAAPAAPAPPEGSIPNEELIKGTIYKVYVYNTYLQYWFYARYAGQTPLQRDSVKCFVWTGLPYPMQAYQSIYLPRRLTRFYPLQKDMTGLPRMYAEPPTEEITHGVSQAAWNRRRQAVMAWHQSHIHELNGGNERRRSNSRRRKQSRKNQRNKSRRQLRH